MIIMYAPLSEGSGNSLSYYCSEFTTHQNYVSSSLQWKSEIEGMNLCPSELTPVSNLNDRRVCCEASYLYIHGYDTSMPSLSLPVPTVGSWVNQGSICFYIFLGSSVSIPFTSHNILFQWLPLNISYSYNGTFMTVFSHRLEDEMARLEFNYTQGVWNALCFTFSIVGSSVQGSIYEAAGKNKNDSAAAISPTPYDFTPTDKIRFVPGYSSYSISFKNFMILSSAISEDEFYFLYWGNAKLYKNIGNILAFWPLTESGNFYEEKGGTYAERENTTIYAGISTMVTEELFGDLSNSYNIYLPRADGWLTLSSTKTLRPRRVPMLTYSIDLGRIRLLNYLQPLRIGAKDTTGLLSESVGLPPSTIASLHHGIKIADPTTYQNYYLSIETEISSGGISIWFFFTGSSESPLISAWSNDGGVYFTYSVLSQIKVSVSGTPDSHAGTINPGTWYHALIIWKTDITVPCFDSILTLDGTSTDSKNILSASSLTEDSPRLTIGAKYTGSGTITMLISHRHMMFYV